MRGVFILTIAVGAALLFVVQPMVGRLLLPLLGGTPMVWNTCMVFFQIALLAGYVYAHLLTKLLPPKVQVPVHVIVIAAAFVALPIGLADGDGPPADATPIGWLLVTLVTMVGLPFFAVSTSAPLLQRWFSVTSDSAARDPYFLYAASNAGSLAALLGYPILVEPLLGLSRQRVTWSVGYGAFVLLTLVCGVVMLRRRGGEEGSGEKGSDPFSAAEKGSDPFSPLVVWTLLAFAPSSLMLGATQQITTDVAAIPFFWVLPLAIYLLTFILAFARRRIISVAMSSNALVVLGVLVMLSFTVPSKLPVTVNLSLNLLLLFAAAMLCHGRLAESRPPPRHLTAFYIAIAVGGALGGVFNTLVAPFVFDGIVEYPLVIAIVFLTRRRSALGPTRRAAVRWTNYGLDMAIVFLMLVRVPIVAKIAGADRNLLFAERTFFGVHRVIEDDGRDWVRYYNGTTCHGLQNRAEPRTLRSYYHEGTGIGQLLTTFAGDPRLDRVGIVGLGVGTLATKAAPGQRWTFYEIDPAVIRIARDPELFTYLRDSAGHLDIVLGDGRLGLERAEDGEYGLIVLDAFASDTIPVHLITREAVELYTRKLRADGLLALHVSNRHVDLRPLIGALASELDLAVIEWQPRGEDDRRGSGPDPEGKFRAHWIVAARSDAALAPLGPATGWDRLDGTDDAAVWTDDFSHLLGALRWW